MSKPRTSYHHGDLRQALVDAAIALIARRGGSGEVTVRAAARRAGVSHNAPYRHFADKGELLAAVAAEGYRTLARLLREAREDVADPEDRFVRTGLAYLRFVHEHRSHAAVMFSTDVAKSRTPELQASANEAFQVLKQLAHDAGVTDVESARRVGAEAWALAHGLAVLTRDGQVPASSGQTPEALLASGMRHLFSGLRSDPPR